MNDNGNETVPMLLLPPALRDELVDRINRSSVPVQDGVKIGALLQHLNQLPVAQVPRANLVAVGARDSDTSPAPTSTPDSDRPSPAQTD